MVSICSRTIFAAKKLKRKMQGEINNNRYVNTSVIFVIIVTIILLLIYFVKNITRVFIKHAVINIHGNIDRSAVIKFP